MEIIQSEKTPETNQENDSLERIAYAPRNLNQELFEGLNQSQARMEQLAQEGNKLISMHKALKEQGEIVEATEFYNAANDRFVEIEQINQDFNTKRQELASLIENGDIILPSRRGGAPLIENSDVTLAYSEALSALTGREVDLSSGLGYALRRELSFEPREKWEGILQRRFPDKQVFTMNVGNSPVTLVEQEDGKLIPIDEMGFSMKDITADLAGDVIPFLGGAGVATIAGAAGAGAIPITVLSAAGYIGAAALQDAVISEENAIDRMPERGFEGVIGMPIDLIMGGIGRYAIGRPATKAFKGKLPAHVAEMQQIGQRLKAKGVIDNDSFVRVMRQSKADRDRLLLAASRNPDSVLRRDLDSTAARVELYLNRNRRQGELPDNFWQQAAKTQQEAYNQQANFVRMFSDEVAAAEEKARNVLVRQAFGGQLTRQAPAEETVGKYVRATIDEGKNNTKRIKNEIYDPFWKKTDNRPELLTDPKDFAKELRTVFNQRTDRPSALSKLIDEIDDRPVNAIKLQNAQSKLAKIESRLQDPNIKDAQLRGLNQQKEMLEKQISDLEAISGPLSPRQLHEYQLRLSQMAEMGELAGSDATLAKQQAKRLYGVARSRLNRVFDQIDPDTGKIYSVEFEAANRAHQNFLQYRQGQRSAALEEVLGETVKTDRQVASFVYQDPQNARNILTTAMRDDPTNFAKLQETMQAGYLKRIGLTGRRVGSKNEFDFDEGMVKTLFSRPNPNSPTGFDESAGDLAVKRLRDLQAQFKRLNLPPDAISEYEVSKLAGALSDRSARDMTDAIRRRVEAVAKMEAEKSAILLQSGVRGYKDAISLPDFPRAVLDKADVNTTKKIFSRLTSKEQDALRKETFGEFMNRYPGHGESNAGGFRLFDGQKFLSDMGENLNSQLAQKAKLIFGEDVFNELVDVARILPAANLPQPNMAPLVSGVISVDGGIPSATTYGGIRGIFSMVGDKYITAKYRMGKPQFMQFLKEYRLKQFDPLEADKLMSQSFAATISTQNGLQALFQTGKYDPDWGYALGSVLEGVLPSGTLENRQEKKDFVEEFGRKGSPQGIKKLDFFR